MQEIMVKERSGYQPRYLKKIGSQLFTVELLQNKMVWCHHLNQLRQRYGEDSDLLGTEKNTSAQAPREPIEYLSFPVEGSRIQNPVDIAVDVAPESDIEQPILPRYPIRVRHHPPPPPPSPDRYS